jgi:hypothetical protein
LSPVMPAARAYDALTRARDGGDPKERPASRVFVPCWERRLGRSEGSHERMMKRRGAKLKTSKVKSAHG